jgi:hypothetical protein
MLLEVDGIAEDYSSDWVGEMGGFSIDDIPEPVRRLLNTNNLTFYDVSSMGVGEDVDEAAVEEDIEEEDLYEGTVVEEDGAIVVRKMNMSQFRQRLIEHFDICFQRKELAWPRQRQQGAIEPTID